MSVLVVCANATRRNPFHYEEWRLTISVFSIACRFEGELNTSLKMDRSLSSSSGVIMEASQSTITIAVVSPTCNKTFDRARAIHVVIRIHIEEFLCRLDSIS